MKVLINFLNLFNISIHNIHTVKYLWNKNSFNKHCIKINKIGGINTGTILSKNNFKYRIFQMNKRAYSKLISSFIHIFNTNKRHYVNLNKIKFINKLIKYIN